MLHFFKENREIQRVISTRYQVIFYAENAYYFQYFRHLFHALQSRAIRICYITSDKNDPILKQGFANVDVVFSKSTLAFAFQKLQADLMILTMPDLGNYIFKRSPGVKNYIYVFHAMVSTHQQYRKGAFDHYDTVFCVGPHHEKEIRESESLYDTKRKELVAYGYPLLNELEEKLSTIEEKEEQQLIAPSWYEAGILQTCIHDVIKNLAPLNKQILVRPHPEFIKRNKKSFAALERTVHQFPNLAFDVNPSLWPSLLSSELLLTDRSGIAFEFALVKKAPVVFIDTPLKIQNRDVEKFRNIPVENRLRSAIGMSIDPDNLSSLPGVIEEASKRRHEFQEKIEAAKKEILYENCLQNAVDYILSQIS
jgi:hypothetical protein